MASKMYTTEEVARRAKQAMSENVSIVYQQNGFAVVKNNSKGTQYIVDPKGKCTCPAGRRFGSHCKHVALWIYTKEVANGRGWLLEGKPEQKTLGI